MDYDKAANAPPSFRAKPRFRFNRRLRDRTYIFASGYGLVFALMAFTLFLMALGSTNKPTLVTNGGMASAIRRDNPRGNTCQRPAVPDEPALDAAALRHGQIVLLGSTGHIA